MAAEFTPGLTFASGGLYTAGHFNDNVRLATVLGIDRSNVNFTLGVFGTRSTTVIPGPTDKEIWIDSASTDLNSVFFTGAFQSGWRGAHKMVFNTGNGSALSGSVLQSSVTNPIGGVPAVGISFASTDAEDNAVDLVGIAYRANATESGAPRVFMAMAGVINVRVSGVVTCGDWLRIIDSNNNEAENGMFLANNDNRDIGIGITALGVGRIGYLMCQAINNKTNIAAGVVLAKIWT